MLRFMCFSTEGDYIKLHTCLLNCSILTTRTYNCDYDSNLKYCRWLRARCTFYFRKAGVILLHPTLYVFASTEIGSIDVILGGSSLNSLAILPSRFTIHPHGSSLFTQLRLQWHSLDRVVSGTDQGNSCGYAVNCEDFSTAVGYLRCICQNIKNAFAVVDADTST